MEERNINSVLIHKFMDHPDFDDYPSGTQDAYIDGCDYQFQEDWNALMPVVKKCFDSCSTDEHYDKYDLISDALYDPHIEYVYKEVVKFIEWYTNNK